MAQWAVFASFTVLVIGLFLALARASQVVIPDEASDGSSDDDSDGNDGSSGADSADDGSTDDPAPRDDGDGGWTGEDIGDASSPVRSPLAGDDEEEITKNGETTAVETPPRDSFTTGALLVNVALSQGLFGALVLGAAWYTEIPLAALGIPESVEAGAIALGVGVGIVLYGLNELAAAGASAFGVEHPEELRTMLAPDTPSGWVLLLAAILPAIALVEELLFRAALIGLSAGFPISPWVLAVVSSVAFAFGHGAQGTTGVLVTGALGFLLATAFVLTGNLLTVVVAHYLVNVLEFVVHEGLDVGHVFHVFDTR